MTSYTYVGSELDLFSAATRWKSYFRKQIRPYLGKDVLEVGAGLGGTTKILCDGTQVRWVCLEPDRSLADRLGAEIANGSLPACCRSEVGTLDSSLTDERFDTILYMDVLEHIEGDAAEMARAASRLAQGGHVIALSPAHNWLFTKFDEAIGHCRRYSRKSLKAITPPGLELVRLDYLDSIGFFASLANRLLLKQSMPTKAQIAVWDKFMVPVSTWVDPILGRRAGKSVLGVWRKA